MNAKDRLIAARAILAQGWTQREYALSSDGTPCGLRSAEATQFCIVGALERIIPYGESITHARALLCNHLEVESLVGWNDAPDRTQADVLALFDRILERLP
jgi:hypothetical protein